MRVDELIFRELHRLIDDQAQQRLLRLGKQRQQHADCAGGQRADVGNKGEGRRQRGGQPRVGNAAQGEREKDHRAEDHDLHALPGQETGSRWCASGARCGRPDWPFARSGWRRGVCGSV